MRTEVQTGSAKGTFKRGDLHPEVPQRYFREYLMRNGKLQEAWMTQKAYERLAARKFKDHAKHKEARNKQKREYANKNREACRDRSRKHYYDNRADYIQRARERSNLIKKKESFLNETDRGIINNLYAASYRISECLDVQFHIDHIIPLSKEGEHAPKNLQIVPAKWNLSKSNSNNDRFPYNTSTTQEF